MKSGRSGAGQKAAGSHTAALAGSDTAVDAVFHQAGVIRADTLSGLLDVAALLSCQPVPRGRRVAVLTNAGGLGILCADACEVAGLELPVPGEETRAALAAFLPVEASVANPVDLLGSATAESFEQALPPAPRRPRHRLGHRSLRARSLRRGGRRRGGDQQGDGDGEPAGQARARGDPLRERSARDAAQRRPDPRVPLSRGSRRRPRPRSRVRPVAAALGRHRACSSAGSTPPLPRRSFRTALARPGRGVARSVCDAPAARGVRPPHRRRGGRDHRRRSSRSRRRARLPGRRQDGRAGRAQDRDGRRRARPQPMPTPFAPRRSGSAAP